MADYSSYIPSDWGFTDYSNLDIPLSVLDTDFGGSSFNDTFNTPYYGNITGDQLLTELGGGGGTNLSSILQGLAPIATGILGKYLTSSGGENVSPGYNQKPAYQTAAEQDILNQFKDYVNQPAVPEWVQSLYYQNIAPTLAGAETGEEKARKAYLKALTDMGMSEYDVGKESYDTAVGRFKDVASGINLKDVSPGFRGTEWEEAMQDYINQNMDVAKSLATLDMTRGKEQQQTLEDLLGMKTSATAASQAATDPLAKASILANAANLPYSQNLAQKGTALGAYSNAANKVASSQVPTTYDKGNPWLQGIGAALQGATQNQVVQNQLPQQTTTQTPSLWKSLFG